MTKVLIVNDCPSRGMALIETLSLAEDLTIVPGMGSGKDMPSLISKEQPDIVLVDISLNGSQWFDVVSAMREQGQTIPVVCLVERLERILLESCLQERVHGLVHKSIGSGALAKVLRRVASGRVFVSPELTDDGRATGVDKTPQDSPDLQHLSAREREILAMVAAGETAADIAHRLGISGSTVYFHRRRIAGKIGLRQTADITRFAVRAGLVTEH